MPRPCSPSGTWPRCPHGRSGRAWRSASCRWAISLASPMSAMVCAIRSESSARCSGERPAIIRSCAAARRARESISSSTVCGSSGKNWPCLSMKSRKPLVGVLAAVVRVDERGQVGDHVLDRLQVLLAGVLQRGLHRGERAVEHLAPQQVLDPLVVLPRLGRPPRVVLQRPDGARGVVGQRVQLGLGQPGGVVGVGEEVPPLGRQRLVEQLPDLLQRAVHPPGGAGLPQPFAHRAAELVEAAASLGAPAQQLAQRLPDPAAGQHRVADLVDGVAQVVGRGERIGAAVPARRTGSPGSRAPGSCQAP